MDHPRRFIFHANATGVTVRIRRPEDRTYDTQGVSCLGVSGGRSSSALAGGRLDHYVSFGLVATFAQGDFHDLEAPKKGDFSGSTTTTVRSEVRELRILERLDVERLRIGLTGASAEPGRQARITTRGNRIDGVRIDGRRLSVELDEGFFAECDTKDALDHVLRNDPRRALDHGIEESGGVISGSLVKEIRWEDPPVPGVAIKGNSVHIPDFGTVYFAELLVTDVSRRLTMLRAELGSPVGGQVSVCGGEDNGIHWPALT